MNTGKTIMKMSPWCRKQETSNQLVKEWLDALESLGISIKQMPF
jgi:hypothetical protein